MEKIKVSLASGTTIKDARDTMDLIQKAIVKSEHNIKHFTSDNPQVVAMRIREEARLETLIAVESSMLGNKVDLRGMT